MSDYARAGLIQTAELADQAVTNPKLGAASVGTNKIADGAVSEAKIADGAVTTAKIAANAVTGTEIATAVVTTAHLAPLSVGSGKIQDAAVGSGKLGSNAVQQSNMNTSALSLSGTISAGGTNVSILLNPYSFFPRVYGNNAANLTMSPNPTGGGNWDNPRFQLLKSGGSAENWEVDARGMD